MLSPKTRTVTESGFDHRLTSSGDGGSAGHDTGARSDDSGNFTIT